MHRNFSLIYHFAEREAKSRYKRSLLGWFWSLANPLVTVGTYWVLFGVVYRAEPPDTGSGNAQNFGLYIFTGLVVWSVFTGSVNGSMQWLAGASELRKKIYFPTETALLGGAVASLLQTGLEALVLIAIMAALANISWTAIFLLVAILLALSFGLGVGFIISVLNARYRDVGYLVGILLNVAFFAVPIVYTPDLLNREQIPEILRFVVEWNPLSLFIQISRDATYFLQVPQWNHLLASLCWAGVASVLGVIYFRHKSMAISEEL